MRPPSERTFLFQRYRDIPEFTLIPIPFRLKEFQPSISSESPRKGRLPSSILSETIFQNLAWNITRRPGVYFKLPSCSSTGKINSRLAKAPDVPLCIGEFLTYHSI